MNKLKLLVLIITSIICICLCIVSFLNALLISKSDIERVAWVILGIILLIIALVCGKIGGFLEYLYSPGMGS